MTSRFCGDVGIFMGQSGSYIIYRSGQPVMDTGLENAVKHSLFVKAENERGKQWAGNFFLPAKNKIGSDYEAESNRTPTTVSKLSDMENSAEDALSWMIDAGLAKEINSVCSMTGNNAIKNVITITKPDGNTVDFELSAVGQKWYQQENNPLHEKE